MQALFRRLGRVLVGLLAGVYGGSELLGGLIAVAVPGAVAVHLIRRGTAVAEPGSRCRIPSPASAPSSSAYRSARTRPPTTAISSAHVPWSQPSRLNTPPLHRS
jgi:hypothetical protein